MFFFSGNHTLYTCSSISTSNQNNLLRSSLSEHSKTNEKQWLHFPCPNSWCSLGVCSFLQKFGGHWMTDITKDNKTTFYPCSNIYCFYLGYTEQTKWWNHGYTGSVSSDWIFSKSEICIFSQQIWTNLLKWTKLILTLTQTREIISSYVNRLILYIPCICWSVISFI